MIKAAKATKQHINRGGMTLEDFSKMTGISEANILEIEAGRKPNPAEQRGLQEAAKRQNAQLPEGFIEDLRRNAHT